MYTTLNYNNIILLCIFKIIYQLYYLGSQVGKLYGFVQVQQILSHNYFAQLWTLWMKQIIIRCPCTYIFLNK